ncbi:hypothetical protein QOZ80_1BG0051470 [Eleusine coracana subsp. coracana]|nr:hypothetical protein QOZ80_1BG0051470 [Eleusine coracana subsp. coracana]
MDRPIEIRTSPRMHAPVAQKEMIEEFWRKRKEEIDAIEDFGERVIPMTRLKKVLSAGKGKMMMTFHIPPFLTKACELFVQELAFRSWMCAASHHRSIILDTDMAEVIATIESYDFLKDILHAFWEEHNSISSSKPTKKRSRSINQASTSSHLPLNQVSQFYPQFAQYPPIARVPLPFLPTNVHSTTLPFPFSLHATPPMMSTIVTPTRMVTSTMISPINYMPMGLKFFGNGINTTIPNNFVMNNNIVASSVITHALQVCARTTTNIPITSCYMNMTNASALSYDIGSASTNGIVSSSIQHLGNEMDQQEQQINIDHGQHEKQHQVEEAILNHPLDIVDGTLDGVVASTSATNVSEDNYDDYWDEFEIHNDSLMSNFWEDIMEVNPASFPDATTSTDLLPSTSDMQDFEEFFQHKSYLFNDPTPTQAQATGSTKAPM